MLCCNSKNLSNLFLRPNQLLLIAPRTSFASAILSASPIVLTLCDDCSLLQIHHEMMRMDISMAIRDRLAGFISASCLLNNLNFTNFSFGWLKIKNQAFFTKASVQNCWNEHSFKTTQIKARTVRKWSRL